MSNNAIYGENFGTVLTGIVCTAGAVTTLTTSVATPIQCNGFAYTYAAGVKVVPAFTGLQVTGAVPTAAGQQCFGGVKSEQVTIALLTSTVIGVCASGAATPLTHYYKGGTTAITAAGVYSNSLELPNIPDESTLIAYLILQNRATASPLVFGAGGTAFNLSASYYQAFASVLVKGNKPLTAAVLNALTFANGAS